MPPSLGLGAGTEGRLMVVFGASDAVAKSGDDETDEVEPVETVHFSELRGRISLWCIRNSLADPFVP